MNWDAIGALAELAGALGVIISLVYLASQIRQNSKHIESSIYQTTNDVFVNWFLAMASDKQLADIWYREIIPDDVKPEHSTQARALVAMFFLAVENNYQHHQTGLVHRDALSSLRGTLLQGRFIQEWLAADGLFTLTPEFLERVRDLREAEAGQEAIR